ncbi:hypothetical protein U1Q18_003402 [Sarracenia purpurea var. burkii]
MGFGGVVRGWGFLRSSDEVSFLAGSETKWWVGHFDMGLFGLWTAGSETKGACPATIPYGPAIQPAALRAARPTVQQRGSGSTTFFTAALPTGRFMPSLWPSSSRGR